jgi:predicted nucleotide-binding protein (sugar kinase/HSP70/actin superfamily)
MSQQESTISSLQSKIEKLVSLHRNLTDENRRLRDELKELREKTESLQKEKEKILNDNKTKELGSILSGSTDINSRELKETIDEILKEIDRCLLITGNKESNE